jgi:hypothetical protein
MKKVLIAIICLFSFIGISLANNKYDSKFYVKENNKVINKINIKDKKEFTIDLYFEAKDFDMYATVFNLDYDKKVLELVKAEGYNNFEAIAEKKVLADRIEIPEKEDHKVLSLTFKVKKNKNTKIKFKNINIANAKEQFEIEDVKIKLTTGCNYIVIAIPIIGVIAVCGVTLLMIKKKK